MFKATKVKKMFDDDEPKLVFYLESKNIDIKEVYKDEEDLVEKCIRYHKKFIGEVAISKCSNINRVNNNNQTYLMLAILYDNFEMFKKLLEYDVRLDILDNNRESALFYAIKNDNKMYFDILIDKGVDLKGFNLRGENTAIYAYLNQRYDITHYLLRNHVFVNHLDKDGNTILHHAIKNHDIDFALDLIDYGADLFIKNYKEENCFAIADNLELEAALINKECEVIDQIFENQDDDKLNELLNEYVDIENYEEFNIPYLIAVFAIKYNNKKIFDRILKNKNLLNSLDYRGKSLLMYCIEFGQFIMARKIIYLKGNLNLQDKDHKTVLFTVCEQLTNHVTDSIKEDYKLIFNELIERKIDVNCQDIDGNTVLMYAIINTQPDIIDKLISYTSVDLNILNKEGKTALLIAYEKNDINTVHKIISSGNADINVMDQNKQTLLLHTLKDDNLELFNALLYYGANLDLKYKGGLTILMIALKMQKNRFVAKIFDYPSFNVNIQDDMGLTPLMHAVMNQNVKVVEALLRCGADTTIVDNKNDSALFYAVTQEAFEIAKLIRDFEEHNLH